MNKTVKFLSFSFGLVFYPDDILQIKCNATLVSWRESREP